MIIADEWHGLLPTRPVTHALSVAIHAHIPTLCLHESLLLCQETCGFLFGGPVMLALPGKGACPAGEEIAEEGRGRRSERDTVTI